MLYTKKETTFFWALKILPIEVMASHERLVEEISGKNNIFFWSRLMCNKNTLVSSCKSVARVSLSLTSVLSSFATVVCLSNFACQFARFCAVHLGALCSFESFKGPFYLMV